MVTLTLLPDDSPTLTVSEVFGPTIQGEGRSQGRAVVFLRLGLCNLDCSWCDTPFTWDWTGKNGVAYDKTVELDRISVDTLVEHLIERCAGVVNRIVISGGEPMIQQKRLEPLIAMLAQVGITVEIETNGTIAPDQLLHWQNVVSYNCSPKLANSGVDREARINQEALDTLARLDTTFKFVIAGPDDIEEVEDYIYRHLPNVAPHRIYVMPEGTTADRITPHLPSIMRTAANNGWGISPRLHVLAYGNERGI